MLIGADREAKGSYLGNKFEQNTGFICMEMSKINYFSTIILWQYNKRIT